MGRAEREKITNGVEIRRFRKKHIFLKIFSIIVLLAILLMLLFNLYVSDYYRTTDEGKSYFGSSQLVEVFTEDEDIYFIPAKPSDTCIIFYPGEKVQSSAYVPLAKQLAERGIYCVICTMPYNLAVFDMDAAENIINKEVYAGINHWYICGHSLGGTMAAAYIDKNSEKYDGLILLASYSTVNLSDSGLSVLSIYGTNDGILNMSKLDKNMKKLPEDVQVYPVEGGNHAGFACYGDQKGDNEASITGEEQRNETVSCIVDFIIKDQE